MPLFLAIVVLSGAVIEWSVYLFFSALDFWVEEEEGLGNIPDTVFRESAVLYYPVHIYSRALAFAITFVFPYAFIAYYPTLHFFQVEVERYPAHLCLPDAGRGPGDDGDRGGVLVARPAALPEHGDLERVCRPAWDCRHPAGDLADGPPASRRQPWPVSVTERWVKLSPYGHPVRSIAGLQTRSSRVLLTVSRLGIEYNPRNDNQRLVSFLSTTANTACLVPRGSRSGG